MWALQTFAAEANPQPSQIAATYGINRTSLRRYSPPAIKAMKVSSPLSPRQIESRMKIFARGRKHFILYRGILGWGLTCFIGTTVCEWYGKYGWHLPPQREFLFDVLRGLVIWSAGGYWFGARMWKRLFL